MPPTVTVLVTNYNHARFLPRRLDSILAQTYRDFELIALDDHSSDHSREILTEYASRFPIRLVFNDTNSGTPFAQWRRGARLAAGKYLWIAESDDFADPRLLETLVAQLELRPDVGLAYCQSFLVDESDRVTGKYNFIAAELRPDRWDADFVNSGRKEVAEYLFRQNTIPNASAVLVRTQLLLSASEHADEMRLMGDWWTWARVLLQSGVAFVAEPLNYFRMHSSSVRNSTRRAVASGEVFRVLAHIRSRVAIPARARRRAVTEGFAGVWDYLESPARLSDPQWLETVSRNARAVHWSAGPRLWHLRFKRQLKRIPLLAHGAQQWRQYVANRKKPS